MLTDRRSPVVNKRQRVVWAEDCGYLLILTASVSSGDKPGKDFRGKASLRNFERTIFRTSVEYK